MFKELIKFQGRLLILAITASALMICTGSCKANMPKDPNMSSQTTSQVGPNRKPIIIWHYNSMRDELRTVQLVLSSGLITHVSIGGTLHRKDKDYKKNSRALEAIKIVKSFGAKVIWVRPLWPLYSVEESSPEDLFDPNYYIREITILRDEKKAVGADFVALDQEAYGYTPLKKYLRGRNTLTESQRKRLENVIEQVIKTTGKVDFILPAGIVFPLEPANILSRLGVNRISETTYYDNAALRARIQYPYEIFGVYLNTVKENKDIPNLPLYLVSEIFDKSQLWSNKKGLFLYPREHNALAVAKELVAYSKKLPVKVPNQ
jgi:hypothetical protein